MGDIFQSALFGFGSQRSALFQEGNRAVDRLQGGSGIDLLEFKNCGAA